MKKISLLAIMALTISMGVFAQNNASVNLKKGQKYVIENKSSTHSSTEVQGQSMESTIDATTTFNVEVKDVAGNNYNLTNILSAVKMNMGQMGQTIEFDSQKKEDLEGPMGSALKDYINKPKSIVIDKSGKVIPQKEDKKADSTDNAANMIAKQLGNFEESGYGAEMAFEALPANIKVGSTWSNKTDNDGIVKTTNYIVTAISGNLATISLTGTLTTDKKMEMQGMEMTVKSTGKFSGVEIADIKTGVVQSNTSTTDATGTVNAMGQEFPTSTKVTSTTTVKTL
jgi:hypothetical protein